MPDSILSGQIWGLRKFAGILFFLFYVIWHWHCWGLGVEESWKMRIADGERFKEKVRILLV